MKARAGESKPYDGGDVLTRKYTCRSALRQRRERVECGQEWVRGSNCARFGDRKRDAVAWRAFALEVVVF